MAREPSINANPSMLEVSECLFFTDRIKLGNHQNIRVSDRRYLICYHGTCYSTVTCKVLLNRPQQQIGQYGEIASLC